MKRSLKERDRLLRTSARGLGLSADAATVACLLVPGVVDASALIVCVLLVAVLAFCHWQLGRSGGVLWSLATAATGLATIVVVASTSGAARWVDTVSDVSTAATVNILGVISGAGIACIGLVLVTRRSSIAVLVLLAVVDLGVVALIIPPEGLPRFALLAITGWSAIGLLGWWIRSSVPRVVNRIDGIGQAHRVERQASETEAQRRQGARLLHDTVLATLTLLAHSGVGVSTSALREQADEDARLLRQLRLGASPVPESSGSYQLVTTVDAPTSKTLESVKGRFGRMGLDVMWHGTGEIRLSGATLESFLLALAECLENVRRHSGVNAADVTITEDETTVRAMVTDAGVGFDIREVGTGKLGFAESVVARLGDVGGSARLFSSPGAGTTVVLEVPR